MDTQSLVSGLQAYRAQLEQVELTLQAGVDPSQQADLLQLQGDLQQLIELTESSLLSMQKSHLLSALDGSPASCPQDEYVAIRAAIGALSEDGQQVLTEECACVDGEQAATSSGEEGNESECADAASGVKVKAPYYSTWGTLEYHNAMIMESECTKDGKPGVRVLYLYPTHKAMKPCPYFLDGKCHYQTSCRFSHGQVVPLDELQDFLEPDVSSLGVDAPCLARHSDGIWYPARITDIDGGLYTVKFDSLLLKDCVLEADGIIPPLRGSDSSSSSEDEVDPLANYGFAKVLGGDEGSSTASCSSGFAGWEAHTRGIGSKLLAQMGYEFGKGLGRNAQGRVEPIQAVLLPKGKSLDACAVIKHRKRGKGQVPSKPRRHRRVKSAGEGCSTSSSRNIFDFLNEKLDGSSTSNLPGDAAGGMQRKGKEVYHASQDTKRALNVRLAKTTERIQQKQKEIGKLRESMARNLGRESVLSAQLQTRLSGALSDLRVLQQEERSLQREQKKAETHKKMTEF